MNRHVLSALVVLVVAHGVCGQQVCVTQDTGVLNDPVDPYWTYEGLPTNRIVIERGHDSLVFKFHITDCGPNPEPATLNEVTSALTETDPNQKIRLEIVEAKDVMRIDIEPDPPYTANVTTEIVGIDITGDFLETEAMTVDLVTGPIAVGGSVLNAININGDLAAAMKAQFGDYTDFGQATAEYISAVPLRELFSQKGSEEGPDGVVHQMPFMDRAAPKFLVCYSDGQVGRWERHKYPDGVTEPEAGCIVGPATWNSVAALGLKKPVWCYRDGNDHGVCRVGSVSGQALTWPLGPVEFNSDSTEHIATVALDEKTFVVCYVDDDDKGKCRIGTVGRDEYYQEELKFIPDPEETDPPPWEFHAQATTFVRAAALDSSRFVVCYADGSNNGKAIVGRVWMNAIEFGSVVEFDAAGGGLFDVACPNRSSVVVCYKDGSTIKSPTQSGDFESGLALSEMLADKKTPAPEQDLFSRSECAMIQRLLNQIDEREAKILKMRFGLDEHEPMTLKEIGKHLKLTRERVRQIEKEALAKLNEMLEQS